MALPPEGEQAVASGSGASAAPKAAKAEEPASGGPESGPASGGPHEARLPPPPPPPPPPLVPLAGPASGGPVEAGPASGGLTGTKKEILDYALHYLDSDVLYYAEVSEAEAQEHQRLYKCEPLVVQKTIVMQNGSVAWRNHAQRGWNPLPGDAVYIEHLFKRGANDLRQINRPKPGGGLWDHPPT